jgi:hypothetical protein
VHVVPSLQVLQLGLMAVLQELQTPLLLKYPVSQTEHPVPVYPAAHTSQIEPP